MCYSAYKHSNKCQLRCCHKSFFDSSLCHNAKFCGQLYLNLSLNINKNNNE